MNISEEVANMSDSQLAAICGGNEPARPSPAQNKNHDINMATFALLKAIEKPFLGAPLREGLTDTPARVAKAWQHWTRGYNEDPAKVLKVFEDGAEGYTEAVLVNNIPIYSHCEHHLAPIFGTATIAYIPDGKIVGLSKLSRVADIFARRLQVQERLTAQIADAIWDNLNPKGVAVWISARHMCMESRGICQQGQATITQAFRGELYDPGSPHRLEFLNQCR